MQECAAGASAGVLGTLIGFPLDTIKVHMQTTQRGFIRTAIEIYNKGGASAFFRGVESPLLSLSILTTLNFWSYAQFKKLLTPKPVQPHTAGFLPEWHPFVAGFLVGIPSSIVATPFELVKIQRQIDSTGAMANSSTLRVARNLLHSQGITGVYRGYGMTLTHQCVYGFVYFGTYETLKTRLLSERLGGLAGFVAVPLAGGLAGAWSWFVSFPVDAVKTIVQSRPLSDRLPSPWSIGHDLIRKKGVRGLYKGIGPSIFRAFLTSGTRFTAYEATLSVLGA